MATQILRDKNRNQIGEIETDGNGVQIARDVNRNIVGTYDPRFNTTYDRNRQRIGDGNLLASLVTSSQGNSSQGNSKLLWGVGGYLLGRMASKQPEREDDYVEEYETVTLDSSEIIKWAKRGDLLKLPLSTRLKALEILSQSGQEILRKYFDLYRERMKDVVSSISLPLEMRKRDRQKALEIESQSLDLSKESLDAEVILEKSLPPKMQRERNRLKGLEIVRKHLDSCKKSIDRRVIMIPWEIEIEVFFKSEKAVEDYSWSEECKLDDAKFYGIPVSPLISSLSQCDSIRENIENDSHLTEEQKLDLCMPLDRYRETLLQRGQSEGKCNNPEERKIKEEKYRERIVEIFQDNKTKRSA